MNQHSVGKLHVNVMRICMYICCVYVMTSTYSIYGHDLAWMSLYYIQFCTEYTLEISIGQYDGHAF